MAYLSDNDKQTQDQAGQQAQQGGQASPQLASSSGGGFVGGGGSSSSGGAQSSTAGAGGTGGWTNIQAYLNANQGNTGTSDALNKQVSGAFGQDQSSLDKQSSDAKQKGSDASKIMGTDEASKLITDASGKYQYGNQNPDAGYTSDVNQVRGALNGSYGGPTSFNYGLSGDSQRYGNALGSDQGFHGLMGDVYNTAAGGQMGSGSLALQSQIDAQNPALASTRQQLLGNYAGLQQNVANTTKDVNGALGSDQSNYANNQAALKSSLGSQQTNAKGQIDSAIRDWNDANTQSLYQAAQDYQKAYGGIQDNGQLAQYNNSVPGGPPQSDNLSFQRWITPGSTATESNIAGVGDQRNQFNTIADILGTGNTIGQDNSALQHTAFNDQGFNNEVQRGVQQWMHNTGRA